MTQKEAIIKEVEDIPDHLNDVLEFIQYLKYRRRREQFEITMASESSLQKDWLLPEEDDAWGDL
ncbi:MAG: DUF2281 domain-containing protein [Calditrichaeota bacterium]|nr:MAG: DUF2281 domain-containing protein [Calditrichota bacterium]